jgi:ABC-type sugar transport system substrate-binding protein
MRKYFTIAGLTSILLMALPAALAAAPAAAKSDQGSIVIVFKDGHRQSFKLAEVARVEFAPPAATAQESEPANSHQPSRGHFLGKWQVGDGNGNTFYITLEDNGDAWKSMGKTRGKWVYVDGEARVSWDDGWQDVLRKVGSKYMKFAYAAGKSFSDTPDNVTDARNTAPKPI